MPTDAIAHHGFLSLVPALLAVVLAFITREAITSLLVACVVGLFIAGEGIVGVPGLFQRALGTADFIWVLMIEVCVGILVAFFQATGSTQHFAGLMARRVQSRRRVQLTGWVLGMFIFFSDYFSPLFTGPVMRTLTDKAKISREKLAYICDSTSAPMCVLVPLTGWTAYIAALLVKTNPAGGPTPDVTAAMDVFIRSIGFNFYAILAVVMVGLFAAGILPEFGPMRRAEKRAKDEGKVLADGAIPMMEPELSDLGVAEEIKRPRLLLNFILPVLIVIGVAVGGFVATGKALILEAFMVAVGFLGIVLWLQRMPLKRIVQTGTQGIKGVAPAVMILALAYCINTISKDLGAATYAIESTRDWLSPRMLPVLTFGLCAFISFATGTSWGTYAIMIPISVPLALSFGGNGVSTLLLATIAAVAGGGVFGDHCSPLSDTTILSSLGAASDHIDHVKTQLPYALVAAALALVAYLIVGVL